MFYALFISLSIMFHTDSLILMETSSVDTSNILVKVSSIDHRKGEVLVGIYDSKKTWRKVKKVLQYKIKEVEGSEEVLVLENIPSGTYAIAIFQDFNGNRKFDSNWMGVPKEPFGFSNNFVVNKRAPKYREVTFSHSAETDTELEIIMQEW